MMAYDQHIATSGSIQARCAIITLSDTRSVETDQSGAKIRQLLESQQHLVADYRLIRDEPAQLNGALDEIASRQDIDVIFTNGGTGISPRDRTIDVLEKRLDRLLPGFGELFRMLSYQQMGSGAMLSRATAGILAGKLFFAMPGSTKAVELAMQSLILPELRHLLSEVRK